MFPATQNFSIRATKIFFRFAGISAIWFLFALSSHSSSVSDKKDLVTSRPNVTTTIGITLVIPPKETLSVLDERLAGLDLNPQPAKGFNFEFNDDSGLPKIGEQALASFCASIAPVLTRKLAVPTPDKAIGLYATDKKSQGLVNYCQRQQIVSSQRNKETQQDLTMIIAPI